MKKNLVMFLIIFGLFLFASCEEENDDPVLGEKVTITIAGSWTDCRAIEEVGRDFTIKYPNVSIEYESVQNYYESIIKRMTGDNMIDIFFTTNIQEGSVMQPYALDLNSVEGLDLSNTFKGLIDNFLYKTNARISSELYAVPLGAEMRGLYVNKTLLSSLGLSVPTNQETLLEACKVLKENGYIPFHGNPADFAQLLLYPWFCNIIANSDNYQEIYSQIENREEGIAELFNEPLEFMYKLVENRYYDYKYAQSEMNYFNNSSDEDYVSHFLNIAKVNGEYEKVDDVGQIAFMPKALSLQGLIEQYKEDYHSDIEYTFIPAPVSSDGGFVYLSPAHGIAINKNSLDLEWSIKFLDFLFQKENNEKFAKYFNVIPNTKEAFTYISNMFDVPSDHISELGQVTFSYNFYEKILPSIISLNKGNNPKYMINLEKDEEGNVKYSTDDDGKEYLLLFDGKAKIYKEFVGKEDSLNLGHAFCNLEYYKNMLKESLEK